MKLKVTITGPKVHDVGYRPFLTEMAMRLALRGFEVYNDDENGQPAVIALAEADEQRIKRFYKSAMNERPQLAEVDSVKSEDYADDIMPLWQSAAINSATQLNKAIPILLRMEKNTNLLPQIAENTKFIPQIAENTRLIPQIAENTGSTPQILEEIKGLREDIQPGFAVQFRQMQVDIRAIKERLGMP